MHHAVSVASEVTSNQLDNYNYNFTGILSNEVMSHYVHVLSQAHPTNCKFTKAQLCK